MNVWDYQSASRNIDKYMIDKVTCPFCNVSLKKDILVDGKKMFSIKQCLQCGWWTASNFEKVGFKMKFREDIVDVSDGYGVLKELDLADITLPVSEITDYLTVKFDKIYGIAPRKFEEVVGSVFKNLGYRAVVTNYSGDKGIDVILHDSASNMIGVQVKRYNDKIQAAQIRELTGSLKLGDYTKGIFVTTSDFTQGAKTTSELSNIKGIPIELMNADRFYDALKLSQRAVDRPVTWETAKTYRYCMHFTNLQGTLDFQDGTFGETPSYDSE